MSDTETHFGKLRKIEIPTTKTIKDFEDDDDKFFIHKNEVYEFIEHQEIETGDAFCKLSKNEDGTISFVSSFYNGGTYLGEMLGEALDDFYKTASIV